MQSWELVKKSTEAVPLGLAGLAFLVNISGCELGDAGSKEKLEAVSSERH